MRPPTIETPRLALKSFADEDAPALAMILAEPEVTKNITANGSTPERCLASARHRIGWHNRSWGERGYGVWAVKGTAGNLLGWCGFAAPDIGDDPEILYGLAPQHWRRGLGMEAARAAMDWLFAETGAGGVSAVIFGRLNPGSAAMIAKLGLKPRGIMTMPDFMPDRQLAQDVLDYEIWRLAEGSTLEADALLFQAPHKGGQFATLNLGDPREIEQAFARPRGAGPTMLPCRATNSTPESAMPSTRAWCSPISIGTTCRAGRGAAVSRSRALQAKSRSRCAGNRSRSPDRPG